MLPILVYASALVATAAVRGAPTQFPAEVNKVQQPMGNDRVVINGDLASTGRISTDEYVQINGIANYGSECSPNGLVGQDGTGQILSCQAGTWQGPPIPPRPKIGTVIRERTEKAYRWPKAWAKCDDDEQVVGGGGNCEQPGGFIWLKTSQPQGNGWYVFCDGGMRNEQGTATAYSICQKFTFA